MGDKEMAHAQGAHVPQQRDEHAGDAEPSEQRRQHGKGAHAVLNRGRSAMVQDIRDAVTVKYDQVFLLAAQTGDILRNEHGYGLYFHDTEYLDQIEMHVNGALCISLLANASRGSVARFELTNPDIELSDGTSLEKEHLSIQRSYDLEHGIAQTVAVRNMAQDAVTVELSFTFASHFTNMFVVRGAEPGKRGTLHPPRMHNGTLIFQYDGADDHVRRATLSFSPAPDTAQGGTVTYHLTLAPHAQQRFTTTIALEDEGPPSPAEEHFSQRHVVAPGGAMGHQSFQRELMQRPAVSTNNPLFDRALQRSFDDIAMLAMASHGDVFISAGVPWYVALFGRDSCISAFEMLAFNAHIARSTLHALATYQGTEHNDFQDEEPGKILHELRMGEQANLKEVPQIPYYGTVDATPLFLVLLAQYVRWTGDLQIFRQLRAHVEHALQWMDESPTRHDKRKFGFLTYGSRSSHGLINQGWKDSGNGVVNDDGSLARPPISLVEVQGYAYRAKRGIAELYRLAGEAQRAEQLAREAEDLKQRFNAAYWMPDKHYYAFCIERDQQLSRAIASNPGQALFGGIVDDAHAADVAHRLLAEDMFTGWGIRTLSANERAYNPLDYQVGSVWPHDNALIAYGLWQHGFHAEMSQVFTGIFEASTHFRQFRLPEVFDGFSKRDYDRPVNYPVACSPQAWAAGALPLLLTVALGLEPDACGSTLHIRRPHLPPFLDDVLVEGLRVGGAQINLRYQRDGETTLVAVQRREGDVEVQIEY